MSNPLNYLENIFDEWYENKYLLFGAIGLLIVFIWVLFKFVIGGLFT